MRVLFITVGDPNRLTGGYLYHARVFGRLRSIGVTIDQIVASSAPPDEQKQAQNGLMARVNPIQHDVIVVDALARAVAAPAIVEWQRRRPVVAMVHELPSVARAFDMEEDAAYEQALLRCDRLVVVSEHGRRTVVARDVSPDKIDVVPPGYDRFDVRSPDVHRRSRRGTKAVLCVAQWIPRKGILELVQAWQTLQWAGAVLYLVGENEVDPAYSAALRREIAKSPGGIVAAGPIPDDELATLYRQAALFVLPSTYEGYGMAFAEALAHGLPIVGWNVESVSELVSDSASILVHSGDVGALAGAISQILGSPALRARLREAAVERASLLPTWDDTARGFLASLERAASAGR